MKKIQPFHIRKIYAIGNALGIAAGAEDELHTLVLGITGKASIKDLTYQEASMVIGRLEELQEKDAPPKSKAAKTYKSKPGGVTSGQQKKIWALMYELKKCDQQPNDIQLGDRLCAVIKKELHMDALARCPFEWLDYEHGNKLIEMLKRYVKSAKKKESAHDRTG